MYHRAVTTKNFFVFLRIKKGTLLLAKCFGYFNTKTCSDFDVSFVGGSGGTSGNSSLGRDCDSVE